MGSHARPRSQGGSRAAYLREDPYGGAPPRRAGGRAERRRLQRKIKRRRQRSAAKEVPILVSVALLIALVLKTFLLQAFVIPSGSMEETIRIGDRVLVDKLTPWFGAKPTRGDVVVFKDPGGWLDSEQSQVTSASDPVVVKQVKGFFQFIGLLPSSDEGDLIKRVVGVGGDTVKCCNTQGRVMVNGMPLTEQYIHPGNPPSEIKFTVKVPQGRLFVMGDHRSNSADSRFHLTDPGDGTVQESNVIGRAFVIAWPMGHLRRLEEPSTFSSVPVATAAGAATKRVADANDGQGLAQLPTPAELSLVTGVVGLYRFRRRPRHGAVVRSGCGGPGSRRTVRTRRARGTAEDLCAGGRRGGGGRLRRWARHWSRPWRGREVRRGYRIRLVLRRSGRRD
jgi:signal peptidase I